MDCMIWRTYHVFGSGSSGTTLYARSAMRLSEIVAAHAAVSTYAAHDGDNGFVGTYSVPVARADSIVGQGKSRKVTCSPRCARIRIDRQLLELSDRRRVGGWDLDAK